MTTDLPVLSLVDLPTEILIRISLYLDLFSKVDLSKTCLLLNNLITVQPRVITILNYDNSIVKTTLCKSILVLSVYNYPKFCKYQLAIAKRQTTNQKCPVVKVLAMNKIILE